MPGNPNHPVVRQVESEWHKLCALVMHKLGTPEVEITQADIAALAAAGVAIVADARGGRFVLRLLGEAEAERLARKEGGLAF